MKMKPEHVEHIKTEINKTMQRFGKETLIKMYETGKFPRATLVVCLQKRFCWDLMNYAGLSNYVSNELYPYLNDDHIYTGLKAVCPTVKRRY